MKGVTEAGQPRSVIARTGVGTKGVPGAGTPPVNSGIQFFIMADHHNIDHVIIFKMATQKED